ncbi:nuclease-related domain-containing protein [Bacillus sp. M6-12]|uniref:nuclease-related domain-containing protein n=1 Tax=Bacillus sp. M6-12 TaxID=2054166 RepID=UPI0015E13028|nr:nuclease-related domain-containing protein [Bacillus sp. M6-12]
MYILIGLVSLLLLWRIVSIYSHKRRAKQLSIELSEREGKKAVQEILDTLPDIYSVKNNVLLIDNRGNTVEFDHIVLSPQGIYLIETKNTKGWIKGSVQQKKWVQHLYGKECRIWNPLLESQYHMRFFKKFCKRIGKKIHVNMKTIPIYSIVVFAHDECKMKQFIPNVLYLKNLKEEMIRGEGNNYLQDSISAKVIQEIEASNLLIDTKVNRRKIRFYKAKKHFLYMIRILILTIVFYATFLIEGAIELIGSF